MTGVPPTCRALDVPPKPVTAPARPDRNAEMEARLLGILHRGYRPIAHLPHRFFTVDETLVIWRRNDLR